MFGLHFSRLGSVNILAPINQLQRAVYDFTSGAENPAVRTTRSGLATCIGPDGTTQWGPHNLLGESSNYETYTRTTGVSAPVPVAAPDGTPTACSITYDGSGTAGSYRFYADGPTPVSGRTCLVSVWLRSATPKTMQIYPNLGGYTTCNVTSVWTRFTCNAFNANGVNQAQLLIYSDTGDNSTFTLEVAWGMIEDVTGTNRTTPSDYVDSTVKNRLGYSNDFANAAWIKTGGNLTVQANSCTGPTGQPAHTLTAVLGGSAELTQTVTVSGQVTTGALIRRRTGTGSISLVNSANAAWIPVAVTNDWAYVANDSGVSGGSARFALLMATTGDQIDICDARLVPGPSAANYYYNAGAAPAVGPIYGLRTDYDPVTLDCKGALIEAQSTNLLLNSATPATQNITTTAQAYTISMWGTGTCTLSGTATGVLTGTGATVRTSLTVTATAGTLTATFSGSNTNGQIEAGSLTSYIPTGAATVTRTADTAQINYDDLAKALPWLMDTNIIPAANVEDLNTWSKLGMGTGLAPVVTLNDTTYAAPDGTFTADKVVFNAGAGVTSGDKSIIDIAGLTTTTGAPYTGHFRIMGSAGTTVIFRHVEGNNYQTVVCSGLGIWDTVPGNVEVAFNASSSMSIGIRQNVPAILNQTATVWIWGVKINPGPVAQTYYPQSSKQGTIVFEGDLTYGAASGAMSLAALENTSANRVEIYKQTAGSLLYGYVNANSATPGSITSGTVFKLVVGFSPSSAGAVLNGSAESAITASAFAAAPNVLKLGNDAAGNAASSMHVRRLRIFSQNLPASTKQALTR